MNATGRATVAQAKARKAKSDAIALRETEKIINASLELMDELPYSSEAYGYAEQIRELAGKIEDYVRGE